MSDLISRKATLKNIEKIRQGAQIMDDIRRAGIIMNSVYLCEEAVRNQPSAEPEIIRCKDCEFYEQPEYRIYENCVRWKDSNGILLPINPDDFCSRAERRQNET